MKEGKNVHIGQLVKTVFENSGMTVSELSRRLHCERTNIYTIFRRRTIDVEQLAKLSQILNHNFLEDAIQIYGLSFSHTQLNFSISVKDFSTEKLERLKEVLRK